MPHSQRRNGAPLSRGVDVPRLYPGPDARLRPWPVPAPGPSASARRRPEKGVDLDIIVFDESTHTAVDAARAVDAELGQIVKSLVFVAPTATGLEPVWRWSVAPIAWTSPCSLRSSGCPGCDAPSAQEAGELTGFVIGGIPPFGHRKPLRVVMDPDLGRFTTVWAAAGTPNAVSAFHRGR